MIIVLAFLLIPAMVFAQPDTLWTRSYDSGGDDYATQILNTADGGSALASSSTGASVDLRMTRVDAGGNTLWSHAYGTDRDDWCTAAAAVPAGGWLMCGFFDPPYSFYSTAYFVRVSDAGDTLWTRTLGAGMTSLLPHAILSLDDGGFLIAGDFERTQSGVMDVYLIRMDANGDTLWTRKYTRPGRESAASLCQLADGNLLIAGTQVPPDSMMMNFYFMKITPQGDTLWTRRYGGPGDDMPAKVLPTADGGAVFAGMTSTFDPNSDIFLGKISGAGDSLWLQLYGGDGEDHAHSLDATSDGGFLVCGHTMSFGDPSGDGYLVRTDSEGNLQWWYLYGEPGIYESFETVKATGDGGVILAGNRIGGPTADIFLVRLDHEQSAGKIPAPPSGFALMPNYPNPFNASTTIAFWLDRPAEVRLDLHDVTGRWVRTLVAGRLETGRHAVLVQADDLASGTYLCRLTRSNESVTQRIILLK